MSMLEPVYRLAEQMIARHEEVGCKLEKEKKRPGGPRPEVIKQLLDQTLYDRETTRMMLGILNPLAERDRYFHVSMYLGFGMFWIGLIAAASAGIKCFGVSHGLIFPMAIGLLGHLSMWIFLRCCLKKIRLMGDKSVVRIATHIGLGTAVWGWVAPTYAYLGVCLAICS